MSSWGCGAAGVAVAWPCNCAAAQLVSLICYVLWCCGAAGVADAAVLVCRGAAGVADAMVLLVAVVSTCWRVSRCCWLLLALQKRCYTVVRQLLLARRWRERDAPGASLGNWLCAGGEACGASECRRRCGRRA